MSMLKDEITVLKSVMMHLDESTGMLVTYQYHTENNESTGKIDRSKSAYRYIARVFKLEDLVKKINFMREDANRLNKFKWPDDPWPWYTSAKYPENMYVADWLAIKLRKIKSWDDGQKVLQGWKNKTATKPAGFSPSAKYEIEGYQDPDGNIVSLTDHDTLMNYVGKNLMKRTNLR